MKDLNHRNFKNLGRWYREKEQKTLYGTIGLTATKSERIVTLFTDSSTDEKYSFSGFGTLENTDLLQMEFIDINRMNGQLANHIKIFKDVNKKTENPDASLIHCSDCKTAEQKF